MMEVIHLKHDELFWSAPVDALKTGHLYDPATGKNICLLCGESFDEGTIYPRAGALHTAARAVVLHVQDAHGGMFDYLLHMNRAYTGLTPHQAQLIELLSQGLSDREIVARTSAGSTSTIRNQRFALREKHKQAKVMVALMDLLEQQSERQQKGAEDEREALAQIHKTASMIDERYAITEAEKADVLARYFDADGNLRVKAFPAREKRKIIILQHIAAQFAPNRQYTETEVNQLAGRYYEDIATVRRYLIQYGFLDRKPDGSAYWLKL